MSDTDIETIRIHAWFSGSGGVKIDRERSIPSTHYEIRFFPNNLELAKLFCNIFKKKFGIEPKNYDRRNKEGCFWVRLKNKKICKYLNEIEFNHIDKLSKLSIIAQMPEKIKSTEPGKRARLN